MLRVLSYDVRSEDSDRKEHKMKAIIFNEFGSSSVLHEGEVPTPVAAKGEILIRVSHTSVNPVDWKIREGFLKTMFPHIFPISPGWDAAGVVESVGEGVTSFKRGDEVYAYARLPEVHSGTYAQFIALPEAAVSLKPKTLSSATSAGVPMVALTAYQVVHNVAKVAQGEQVLITGGAGGVGSYAIQLSNLLGGIVTSTTSTKNREYVSELGAKCIVDYTEASATSALQGAAPDGYDVIIDTVGGEALTEAVAFIKPGGRVVSVVDTPKGGTFHFVYASGQELTAIATLFDAGSLRAPETTVRSIREAAAAQDENRTRRIRGKVVLAVDL